MTIEGIKFYQLWYPFSCIELFCIDWDYDFPYAIFRIVILNFGFAIWFEK